MTNREKKFKRAFDVIVSLGGLALLWPLLILCWVVSTLDTRSNGLFRQVRVGQEGKLFKVNKIRTMSRSVASASTITTVDDLRITRVGRVLRRFKLDELPQLWNVLVGDMSLVGPRPDVPGYLDRLSGDKRRLMRLRPGITGPATLKYRNEEVLLAKQQDPQKYNDEVIWPDKVNINLHYFDNWSLLQDFQIIVRTLR